MYHTLRRGNAEHRIDNDLWLCVLDLAIARGWTPLEAARAVAFARPVGMTVSADDARNLAKSIEADLPEVSDKQVALGDHAFGEEHTEALLCLVDEQGEDAVPDLIAQLGRDARLANRRMARLPLYRGCDLVLRGVSEARKGNARAARRAFARARARRAETAHGVTYMDTWIKVRIAIETWRLGDPREDVSRQLDDVDRMYQDLDLRGMRTWLARMREIHGV